MALHFTGVVLDVGRDDEETLEVREQVHRMSKVSARARSPEIQIIACNRKLHHILRKPLHVIAAVLQCRDSKRMHVPSARPVHLDYVSMTVEIYRPVAASGFDLNLEGVWRDSARDASSFPVDGHDFTNRFGLVKEAAVGVHGPLSVGERHDHAKAVTLDFGGSFPPSDVTESELQHARLV
ncbi:hypothetical protein Trco_004688 [Trichoderma cornu-damae]|uniref:Uncharacterized protein n=1 Tax=Trichoderma cornu-damae TaxID=654480 RepID=A0A9P8QLT9_9HYPO|nr:hypothetical protein Trco_004688 [Trichoderma cornu-damae]